jgi:hypothetical protein
MFELTETQKSSVENLNTSSFSNSLSITLPYFKDEDSIIVLAMFFYCFSVHNLIPLSIYVTIIIKSKRNVNYY